MPKESAHSIQNTRNSCPASALNAPYLLLVREIEMLRASWREVAASRPFETIAAAWRGSLSSL
jgi:hypothetical protein